MVSITDLWLPILLSSVTVFVASFVMHMVLPLHRNDYKELPGEDEVREAMRKAGVVPGNFVVPRPANPKEMSSPEMMEKYKEGPVAIVNVFPNGPPAMGKALAQWFVFCILVGVFVAYLAGRSLSPGADYVLVFRFVSTAAFLAYGAAQAMDSIWRGQAWSTTVKHWIDAVVYSLLSAGVFGWLWPR
jgi:hypothetical protein